MIVNMIDMLNNAKIDKYCVGAFNFNDFSELKTMVSIAIKNNSPIILMASVNITKFWGIKELVYIYHALCENNSTPCALHLDHAKDFPFIKECIKLGFTSVMIDASLKPFEENIEITKRVVDFSRDHNVSVEAELGEIGMADNLDKSIKYINPDVVNEFVEKTGINAIAIGVGTKHGLYREEPLIRYDLIDRVSRTTDIPLVLHGGTGLERHHLINAIKFGISKINFGTEIKQAFSKTVFEVTKKSTRCFIEPRELYLNIQESCGNIINSKMELLGCIGKAI